MVTQKIAVVLATFNGARYLEEQIRSLQTQDLTVWRILARDDGSTDQTPDILARLARGDSRITILKAGERLGVVGNFAELLSEAHRSGAEYVALCDQDDVWRPDKLTRTLALLSRLEAKHGRDMPVLVHSDLEVVDSEARPVHTSFLRFQGFRHEERNPLQVLLVQNFVTGCACLLNQALLDFALPIPDGCIMHDWWIAQCAAARGAIGFVPQSTIRYRQHAANQVGAEGEWSDLNPLHVYAWRRLSTRWKMISQTIGQARALHERMIERGGASADLLRFVNAYACAADQPAWRRVRSLRALGIRRQRLLDTLLLFAHMGLPRFVTGGAPALPTCSNRTETR